MHSFRIFLLSLVVGSPIPPTIEVVELTHPQKHTTTTNLEHGSFSTVPGRMAASEIASLEAHAPGYEKVPPLPLAKERALWTLAVLGAMSHEYLLTVLVAPRQKNETDFPTPRNDSSRTARNSTLAHNSMRNQTASTLLQKRERKVMHDIVVGESRVHKRSWVPSLFKRTPTTTIVNGAIVRKPPTPWIYYDPGSPKPPVNRETMPRRVAKASAIMAVAAIPAALLWTSIPEKPDNRTILPMLK